MKRAYVVMILLFVGVGRFAWGCMAWFPSPTFDFGGANLRSMPELTYMCELDRLIFPGRTVATETSTTEADPDGAQSEEQVKQTADVDRDDVSDALKGRAERAALLSIHEKLRVALDAYAEAVMSDTEPRWENGALAPAPVIAPFDLAPYEDFLAQVPEEFSLYLRGAAAYHGHQFEAAAQYFSEILALPAAARKHRSTWAAFMMGKSLRAKAPMKAVTFYQQTRALIADGFPDTLDLAGASRIWEARADVGANHFAAALRVAVEHARLIDDSTGVVGLIAWICAEATSTEHPDPELLQDPLCRQIMTAYTLSGREGADEMAWLKQLNAAAWDGVVEGADRLAWVAYDCGDMDGAAQWLTHADEKTRTARIVRARLLMREAKFDEGAALLATVDESTAPEFLCDAESYNALSDQYGMPDRVGTDYGFALTKAAHYAQALDTYIKVGSWEDAAYLCDRVLTLDELKQWISRDAGTSLFQAKNPDGSDATESIDRVRSVIARRLARDGQWEEAAKVFPDAERVSSAKDMAAHLKGASDVRFPFRERAQHYFEAAEILRGLGMELLGTEYEPDVVMTDGQFSWGNDDGSYSTGLDEKDALLPITPDERARFAASLAKPFRRFHYRYIAGDLYWACAGLLPRNDVLAARALYEGGKWLSKRDPENADRFYKALVRRNPNLKIARDADVLRWFPVEFDETVLYLPRPPHLPRRLVAGMAAVAGMLGAFVALDLRDQRRKQLG